MPIPSDFAAISANEAYRRLRVAARDIRRQCQRMKDKITADTINSSDVMDGLWEAFHAGNVRSWRHQLNDIEAAGHGATIQRMIRDDLDDPTYNLATQYAALLDAMQAVVDWIEDSSGIVVAGKEVDTIEHVNGERRAKVYAAGQMDDLGPLLDAVAAHID